MTVMAWLSTICTSRYQSNVALSLPNLQLVRGFSYFRLYLLFMFMLGKWNNSFSITIFFHRVAISTHLVEPQVTYCKNSFNRTVVYVSLAFTASLAILVTILCTVRRIYERNRPRITKRFKVTNNTQMTSRPATQCEITIENCCNMNVCETVSGMFWYSETFTKFSPFVSTYVLVTLDQYLVEYVVLYLP